VASEDLTSQQYGKLDRDDVCLALNQILASRPFRNSNQCSGLLRYIVEHSLAGEENLLRERVIGAEVFGRSADYETSEDPVVRLRVAEVRKRLAQYYLSARAPGGVQIELPPGAYRATFRWNAEAPAAKVEREPERTAAEFRTEPRSVPVPESTEVPIEPILGEPTFVARSRSKMLRIIAIAIAILMLAAIGALALFHANSSERTFRTFWAPWMNSQKPVIVSIGSNAVYRLQYDYAGRYSKEHGLDSQGQEFYIPFGKDDTLSAGQFFPARNTYVALGDVAAISHIVTTLTREKQSFQERFPNDVSFAELESTPAILIGGFNNPMTVELAKHLEFVMKYGNEIDDTLKPDRKWVLNVPEDAHETGDYAIITRIVRRNGDSPIISVAGLGQYGTSAAAEAICSPISIHLITDPLPKDWASKNLQAVLRISVVDFKPSVSEVVAFRSW
jgi:hypothetical protein